MSNDPCTIFWARLIAVVFLTAQVLHADDAPAHSAIPEGYKEVHLQAGGTILVKKESNPFQHVRSSDPTEGYKPDHINFSAASQMANKSFSLESFSYSKHDSALGTSEQNTYLTKAYPDLTPADEHTVPNLNRAYPLPTSNATARHVSDLSKSYTTSSASIGRNSSSTFDTSTSDEQNRTAVLGKKTNATFASTMATKKFTGKNSDVVSKAGEGAPIDASQLQVKDLPNRPLTIDEVRALINHGFKPNTEEKPDEDQPSKPLNDPDYKPEPLRDLQLPPLEDDSNDPVPPPGTMAQPPPENTEPLPQH